MIFFIWLLEIFVILFLFGLFEFFLILVVFFNRIVVGGVFVMNVNEWFLYIEIIIGMIKFVWLVVWVLNFFVNFMILIFVWFSVGFIGGVGVVFFVGICNLMIFFIFFVMRYIFLSLWCG